MPDDGPAPNGREASTLPPQPPPPGSPKARHATRRRNRHRKPEGLRRRLARRVRKSAPLYLFWAVAVAVGLYIIWYGLKILSAPPPKPAE